MTIKTYKKTAISTFFCFMIFITLSGCVGTPNIIDKLAIQNETNTAIYDVAIRIPKTNAIISCGTILPGRECAIGFHPRKHKKNPATLSWTHHGQIYNEQLIENNEPQRAQTSNDPHTAIVSIYDHGMFKAVLDKNTTPIDLTK